ncbi:MAG TPA: 2-dehydropantoate 2-reductase [candidate division Zixibacteria bacterium]|nr:2-dehydropantoate 2-reductase [candidate division Zixibacteria bacterium]
MRVAVVGAGAVGGYFGARLAAAGESVVFVARGAHLEAMRRDGLEVRSPGGDLRIRDSLCVADPAAAGPVDLVLFCVKSYDTDGCAETLGPLLGQQTAILSLQNGVDNADKIARRWGERRVLAGVVYLAARLAGPGRIEHTAEGRIVLGTLDGSTGTVAGEAARVFAAAQIPCKISPEIRRVQWAKLLWNAPFCAIAALTRATVREIVESESLSQLALDCMTEVREAAAIRGIVLAPETARASLEFSRSLGEFKPSMLQDLEAGKPLEYEAFNGVVVKLLSEAGKKAPINQLFYGMLGHLDARIRAASSGRPRA